MQNSNTVLFGSEARKKLKAGIDIVYKAVSCTLGAAGRNVVYNKWSRIPIITNDGVSIAREISPSDLGELQGANLIKQVSERTNDQAGDGTTTSIVIAHSIIEDGMALLDNPESTINPMQLRREISDATDKVLGGLKKMAIPVDSLSDLENVATISVEDPEIGKTIAKAIYDAGEYGIVYTNDSEQLGVSIEKVEGYQFQQGLITPYLISNPERMETVLNNPAIILTEMPVHLNEDFVKLIGSIAQKTRDILLVCDEFHPQVRTFAVENMAQGKFRMAIVKKPIQENYMEDLAALTNATAMTSDRGKIKYSLEYVGGAKKVIVNMKTTTIVEGAGMEGYSIVGEDLVKTGVNYLDNLKAQLESAEDEVTKTKLQERIARFTGGVFMLNVGDKTEAEQKYLRMKVDDAVNAVKAAREEGIVPGGGMALYRVAKSIFDLSAKFTGGDYIVRSACWAPYLQILKNAGVDPDSVVLSSDTEGYNVKTMMVEDDIIKAGIIDPVKVTRNAFANASGFAGLLLTTETVVIPNPEADPVPSRN